MQMVGTGSIGGTGSTEGPRASIAVSAHPVPAHAVAECAGRLLDVGGEHYSEVLVLADTSFAGAIDDVVAALGTLVGSAKVLGLVTDALFESRPGPQVEPVLAVLGIQGGDSRYVFAVGQTGEAGESPGGSAVELFLTSRPHSRGTGPDTTPGGSTGMHLAGAVLGPRGAMDLQRTDHGVARRHSDGVGLVFPAGSATLVASWGVRSIGEPMETSEVLGTDLVTLDGMPAQQALETALHSVETLPRDTDLVGFTVPGSPDLLAARSSPSGLSLSRPVDVGSELVPAVRSPELAYLEMQMRLRGLARSNGPAPTVVLVDHETAGHLPTGVPSGVVPGEQATALAAFGMWGSAGHGEPAQHPTMLALCLRGV